MPYAQKRKLPESVQKNLPLKAQDIYLAAYNSAWKQYKEPDRRQKVRSREETAHAVAWAAVKEKYRKDRGRWRSTED